MKDQKKKIKVSELKINEQLTELRPINIFIVNRYQQNYRSGATFPEIIVNKKTGMIVSGNHRASAILREYGGDHVTTAIFRTYKNDREMLEDFVNENIAHGNPLTMISKKMIVCKLIDMGATNQEIANLLNIPIKRVEKMGSQFVLILEGKNGCETTHKTYPVKRGPDINKPISAAQYETHIQADRGVTFEEMADQIIRWCQNGWIEKTPENLKTCETLMEHLGHLIADVRQVG